MSLLLHQWKIQHLDKWLKEKQLKAGRLKVDSSESTQVLDTDTLVTDILAMDTLATDLATPVFQYTADSGVFLTITIITDTMATHLVSDSADEAVLLKTDLIFISPDT